ncbi:MAG: hypothetical protein ACOX6Y_10000 [Christensenellales bacterium]
MMSPMLIKVMIGALGALGGTIIGALSRQPEINKLKKLVKKLQAEIKKLQELRDEQDQQIKELLIRYKGLKAYQFFTKYSVRKNIRSHLIFQYGTRDYLDLLVNRVNGEKEAAKEDTVFCNIFNKIIDGDTVTDEEKHAVKEYILYKHRKEIRSLQECDTTQAFERLKAVRV